MQWSYSGRVPELLAGGVCAKHRRQAVEHRVVGLQVQVERLRLLLLHLSRLTVQ